MKKTYTTRKRNDRLWFEDGDACVLTHTRKGDTLVRIAGLHGDTAGEVIYEVEEVCTALRYPTNVRDLRPVKDAAERDELIARGRSRGESRTAS